MVDFIGNGSANGVNILSLDPDTMTLTQLYSYLNYNLNSGVTIWVDRNGEYILKDKYIYPITQSPLSGSSAYTAGAISSRYFDITNGGSYRSNSNVYCLTRTDVQYLAYFQSTEVVDNSAVYGFSNENISATQVGEAQKLFSISVA